MSEGYTERYFWPLDILWQCLDFCTGFIPIFKDQAQDELDSIRVHKGTIYTMKRDKNTINRLQHTLGVLRLNNSLF